MGLPWLSRVRPDASSVALSARRRGALSIGGTATQGLVRLFTNLLVGRMAGAAALGQIASAVSFAQLLVLLWPTTTGSAASKFVASARGRGDGTEARAISAHLARRTLQAGLLLAAAALPLWRVVDGGSWRDGIFVSFLVLGYSGYSFTRGLLYGSGQVARSTIYDFASALIALLALFTTLAFGVTNLALLLSLSTGYLLYAGLNWPSSHDRPSKDLRRAMDFFVLFGAIGTLASSGFLQLSVIAARLVGGAEGAGQYAAAFTLAVPPSLIAGSVSLLLFPSLSAAWGRGDRMEFRRQTDRALRLLMVTMVSVFGTLTIFAEILIEVAWGAPFRAAGDYLPLLLLALLMNSLGIASVNAIITRSDRGVMVTTATTVAGMLIGVTVWLTLTPTAGVLGVATGYLVGTFLIAGVPTAIVWKTDGHRWGGLFIRLAIGIATLLAAYALVTHFALSWLGTSAMTSLFLAIWLSIMHSECRGIMELIRNQQ